MRCGGGFDIGHIRRKHVSYHIVLLLFTQAYFAIRRCPNTRRSCTLMSACSDHRSDYGFSRLCISSLVEYIHTYRDETQGLTAFPISVWFRCSNFISLRDRLSHYCPGCPSFRPCPHQRGYHHTVLLYRLGRNDDFTRNRRRCFSRG